MKSAAVFLAAFLGVCLLAAFVCWCGGYNFDQRNSDVAFGAALTLWFALWAGVVATAAMGVER